MTRPGASGTASVSPGSLALNAMFPGPFAHIITSGSPARIRFQPPFMGRLFRLTFRSLCSSAWWANHTQSSSCSDISATGT